MGTPASYQITDRQVRIVVGTGGGGEEKFQWDYLPVPVNIYKDIVLRLLLALLNLLTLISTQCNF